MFPRVVVGLFSSCSSSSSFFFFFFFLFFFLFCFSSPLPLPLPLPLPFGLPASLLLFFLWSSFLLNKRSIQCRRTYLLNVCLYVCVVCFFFIHSLFFVVQSLEKLIAYCCPVAYWRIYSCFANTNPKELYDGDWSLRSSLENAVEEDWGVWSSHAEGTEGAAQQARTEAEGWRTKAFESQSWV